MLIGISGKAGHGKNSLAKIITIKLINDFACMPTEEAFADELKRIAGELFFSPDELQYLGKDLYANTTKSATAYNMTFGTLLQSLGMYVRETLGSDFWIKKFEENRDANLITLVTDVRLINEAEYVKRKGYLIRVERPDYVEPGRDPEHISETALDGYQGFDYTLRAQDLGELQREFDDIWLDLKSRPGIKQFFAENNITPAQH